MNIARASLLLAALLGVNSLFADTPPPPDQAARVAEIKKLAASLTYQKGTVTLHDGLAKIKLNDDFRYLSPKDTTTVLSKLWGNPEDNTTLGMIVPADFNPFGDSAWAVVISFVEDGYVKDDDAAKIDYTKLLQDMKDGAKEENDERTKQGYPPIQLVGWASPPRYDAASHKLYWAKEIQFGAEPEHTLNYNIRLLGRRGVLVLNAIASMSQLKSVEKATPTLLTMVDFQEGHRYADFNNDTDKVATYGIAALVAGGIAAKAGFFKLLWVGILAFKKLIILGFIALAGYSKKLIAWIRGRNAAPVIATGGDAPKT